MMQMFEVAATLFDSILTIWFVTRFCKLESKRRYQIGAVLLILCVTVFCDKSKHRNRRNRESKHRVQSAYFAVHVYKGKDKAKKCEKDYLV